MASPTTLGAIGLGTSLLGGITGAAGAAQAGAAQQSMYNYQASMAQINSQISLQNADYARQQGEMESSQAGLKGAQQMGAIKTAQSSSGLDVNSGSAVDVRNSQATITSLNLDQIRSNAAKTAYSYDVQSTQYQDQAQLYSMAGANAAAAASINEASSILGSATAVSTKWLQGQQMGLWGSSGSNFTGAMYGTSMGIG